MSVVLECLGCREMKEFKEVERYPVCEECKVLESRRREAQDREPCSICGYVGVLDSHHVHGRSNSNVTIRICANCHREIHLGGVAS